MLGLMKLGWLERSWLGETQHRWTRGWTGRPSSPPRPAPSTRPALSRRTFPLAETHSPCSQLLEPPETISRTFLCDIKIVTTNPSSADLSDGVAKKQVVSALSTLEEVEQGAFESFSSSLKFKFSVKILENR